MKLYVLFIFQIVLIGNDIFRFENENDNYFFALRLLLFIIYYCLYCLWNEITCKCKIFATQTVRDRLAERNRVKDRPNGRLWQ